jgi:hypothetical protein
MAKAFHRIKPASFTNYNYLNIEVKFLNLLGIR